jgi:hypothetical protein
MLGCHNVRSSQLDGADDGLVEGVGVAQISTYSHSNVPKIA